MKKFQRGGGWSMNLVVGESHSHARVERMNEHNAHDHEGVEEQHFDLLDIIPTSYSYVLF